MHLQIWGKVSKVQEEESMIISLLHKTMKKKVCTYQQYFIKVWTKWSTWSKCTTTCGKGTRTRSRKCLNKNGKCKGKYDEKADCEQAVCNVSCKWCQWSEWTRPANNTTCGKATRSRKPNCPAVAGGGYPCLGQTTQEKEGSDLPATAAFGIDYHRLQDWRKNRFGVTCPGGCFEVTKVSIMLPNIYVIII